MDQMEHQVQMPLPARDSRGWWVYHTWGLTLVRGKSQLAQVQHAEVVGALARIDQIGYERDGRYWVQ